MNPKKRAELMVGKYIEIINDTDTEKAKRCAIEAVRLMRDEYDGIFQGWLTADWEMYWDDVVKEITNI